jgi:1A family penicillin-binding protein
MLRLLRLFLSGCILAIIIMVLIVFGIKLPESQTPFASIIYDINNQPFERIFIENRIAIPISEMPEHLLDAIVAIEDLRFYKHFGVDPIAILRAFLVNLRSGRIVEGGSTITQQLAWNLYLTHEKTLDRKIREAILAIKLEFIYSKDEILEKYLNEINFGTGRYGVEVAALSYFGKHAKELTLAESAMIAGIPKSPEYYSPFNNLEASKSRQELVLNKMAEYGFITPAEAESAKKQEIVINKTAIRKQKAPYFIQFLTEEIRQKDPELSKDLLVGGYKIYTTLDTKTQDAAETYLRDHLKDYKITVEGVTQPQAAVVAIDPKTGGIRAMIGGRDYSETKYNRALALRQPGSAFKPFLYTTVIEIGNTAISQQVCEPVSYPMEGGKRYEPTDHNGGYHYRPLTIRESLALSDNVTAVKWMAHVKPNSVIQTAKKMGIQSELEPYLSLALGASSTTPIEMAAAYAVLANGGSQVKPFSVLKVEDAHGNVVFSQAPSLKKVVDENVAYLMTDLLKSVLRPGGTGSHLNVSVPAAGKTGTTQNRKDAWFVGYSPALSVSVYVGFDKPTHSLWSPGGYLAGPIWAGVINSADSTDFPEPDGITRLDVCSITHKLPNWTCPVRQEVFIKGTEPKEWCPVDHSTPWEPVPAPPQTDNTAPVSPETGIDATAEPNPQKVEEVDNTPAVEPTSPESTNHVDLLETEPASPVDTNDGPNIPTETDDDNNDKNNVQNDDEQGDD